MSTRDKPPDKAQELQQQQDKAQELLVTQQADIISHINPNIYPCVDNKVFTTPIIISNISEDAITKLVLPTLGTGPIMYSSFLIAYNNLCLNENLSNIITSNTLSKNSVAAYEGHKIFRPFDTLPNTVDKYNEIDLKSSPTLGIVKTFTITIYYLFNSI